MVSGIGLFSVSGSYRFKTPEPKHRTPSSKNCPDDVNKFANEVMGERIPPILAKQLHSPSPLLRITVGKSSAE